MDLTVENLWLNQIDMMSSKQLVFSENPERSFPGSF